MDDEKPATGGDRTQAANLTELAAAAVRPPAGPLQTALDWRPDGTAELTAAPPAGRFKPGVRHTIRGDARRTAEYLASRGKLPAEVLQDVVSLGMVRAIRLIAKETGCTRLQALDRWHAMTLALLPFTAPRFETIELGPQAAGGLALGHYLAASAMSDLLATRRESRPSQEGITLDAASEPGLPFQDNGLAPSRKDDNGAVKAALPPKAPD